MAYTTIDKSSLHFSPTLYVGNGGTTTVTGVPFEPDMTWIKNRSGATDNEIYDKVRGVGYRIYTNTTAGQDDIGSQGLSAWTSDGFTVGNNGALNGNGNNQVSWNWKANGAGVANTDGSISSTVSANTTSGFSIVKYAGNSTNSTIGHGLGAEPEYIIFKEIDGAESWRVWSKYTPNTSSNALALNLTNGAFSQTGWISAVSSSTISIGTDSSINTSGNNYIAYVFAPKQGFSKFGSYTGNGSTDGTFVYTGFKPAFVMYKNTTQADSWFLHDNKRLGYNNKNKLLFADITQAESTVDRIDLFSNGFKATDSDKGVNASGNNYIYMAFAEAPLVGTNNIPCTAR